MVSQQRKVLTCQLMSMHELVQKWLEDGTIDGLIEKNGIQPSYEEPAAEATDEATDAATDEAAE